ncbi:MAG: DICT sensory domain-containing protein [Chloroflexota bacterium]
MKDEVNAVDIHGIGAFVKRFEEAVSYGEEPLTGFTFLHNAKLMLSFTREIEQDILHAQTTGPLYVGFQNALKLEAEAERYRRLKSIGVTVYGFGEGDPARSGAEGLAQWKPLEANHALLENQWFLVSTTPKPIAFVGWEVSAEEIWGKGGISAPSKAFAGFVSGDERVVGAIVAHLNDVRLGRSRDESPPDDSLLAIIKDAHPRRIVALVDEGQRPFLKRALSQIAEAAGETGAELYLYDLAAASYLVHPVPHQGERWKRPYAASALRLGLGRAELANLIDAASTKVPVVKGILPEKVGLSHLAEWCLTEDIDTVVVPAEFTRPSLIERLQGLSLEALVNHSVGVTIIVEDPLRGPWVVPAIEQTIGERVPA